MQRSGKYLLADIPADLATRGWEWVESQSTVFRTFGGLRYQAVYVRPFAPGIDDQARLARRHAWQWVRISTAFRSRSWEEARRDAIALMRDADAKRQPAP